MLRARSKGIRKCVAVSSRHGCDDYGRPRRRQWRRNSEMVATVVAATTVAMASAWLGDLAVVDVAVTVEDVAGRRGEMAVVVLAVGGHAVVACGVVWCGRVGGAGVRRGV